MARSEEGPLRLPHAARRLSSVCSNSDGGALGSGGTHCAVYAAFPSLCGSFDDDDDFSAQAMCCVCGGGTSNANGAFITRTELDEAVNLWTSDAGSAEVQNGHINTWNVSLVRDLSSLFYRKRTFNDDIDDWDTSQVTTLQDTFSEGAVARRGGCGRSGGAPT